MLLRQQGFHFAQEIGIAGAGLLEERHPAVFFPLQRGVEKVLNPM